VSSAPTQFTEKEHKEDGYSKLFVTTKRPGVYCPLNRYHRSDRCEQLRGEDSVWWLESGTTFFIYNFFKEHFILSAVYVSHALALRRVTKNNLFTQTRCTCIIYVYFQGLLLKFSTFLLNRECCAYMCALLTCCEYFELRGNVCA